MPGALKRGRRRRRPRKFVRETVWAVAATLATERGFKGPRGLLAHDSLDSELARLRVAALARRRCPEADTDEIEQALLAIESGRVS